MRFNFETIIHCPVEDVYEFLWTLDERDFRDNPVVPVYERITEGPRGVGSIIREVIITPFYRMEIFSEIVRVVSNECLEYKFWSDGMRGELVYHFEAVEDRTRLMQRVDIRLVGMQRLATPVLPIFYKPRVQRRLENIKNLLENKE